MKERREHEGEISSEDLSPATEVLNESLGNVNMLLRKISAYDGVFGQLSPQLKKEWLEVQEKAGLYEFNPIAVEEDLKKLLLEIEAEVLKKKVGRS